MTQGPSEPVTATGTGDPQPATGVTPPDTGSANQFDAGYGKGADKGRREVLEALGYKNLDDAKTAIEARKAAETDALKEQNKYKELYETTTSDHEVFKADAELWKADSERWNSYKTDKRTALLDGMSDDDKAIYGDLSLEALEKHVAKLPTTKGSTAPPPGSGAKVLSTTQEAAAAFARKEITIDEYAKIRSQNLPGTI